MSNAASARALRAAGRPAAVAAAVVLVAVAVVAAADYKTSGADGARFFHTLHFKRAKESSTTFETLISPLFAPFCLFIACYCRRRRRYMLIAD